MKKSTKIILFISMLFLIVFCFQFSERTTIILTKEIELGFVRSSNFSESVVQIENLEKLIFNTVENISSEQVTYDYETVPQYEDVKVESNNTSKNKSTTKQPAQNKTSVVNFDNTFKVRTANKSNMQSLLDAGYLIYYYGDYFHHNTAKFMNLFWKCSTPGTKIILNKKTYYSGGIYHGYDDKSSIIYDSGKKAWEDSSSVELITCDGHNTNKRWVLVLKTK